MHDQFRQIKAKEMVQTDCPSKFHEAKKPSFSQEVSEWSTNNDYKLSPEAQNILHLNKPGSEVNYAACINVQNYFC